MNSNIKRLIFVWVLLCIFMTVSHQFLNFFSGLQFRDPYYRGYPAGPVPQRHGGEMAGRIRGILLTALGRCQHLQGSAKK